MKVLLAWVGGTDLNAEAENGEAGSGPIYAAVTETKYDRVILLNNYPAKDGSCYAKWLRKHTESEVEIHHISLPSPTDFGEIYKAVVKTLEQMRAKYGDDVRPTFHLSGDGRGLDHRGQDAFPGGVDRVVEGGRRPLIFGNEDYAKAAT
jgi:hypothetical protein